VISGLILGYKIARKSVLWLIPRALQIFAKAFGHPNFRKVAVEFFTDAAVLTFVFPVLDRIVADKPVTSVWVLASIGLALLFLFLAGILSRAGND
jgi:hypothetical protein